MVLEKSYREIVIFIKWNLTNKNSIYSLDLLLINN